MDNSRIKRTKIKVAATPAILASTFLIALTAVLAGCSGAQQQNTQQQTTAANIASTDSGGTGRLEIPETYYDFGSVPVGQLVMHEFVIRNSGSGTLNLTKPDVKLLEGC